MAFVLINNYIQIKATKDRIEQLEQKYQEADADRTKLQKQSDKLKEDKKDLQQKIDRKKKEESKLRKQIKSLKAAKLERERKARLSLSQPVSAVSERSNGPVIGKDTGDLWSKLRMCESGNDYAKNTGNGYFGAYQFSATTWNAWKTGYSRADLAPPAVQDATAYKNVMASVGGFSSQHPGCFKSLGLPLKPSYAP